MSKDFIHNNILQGVADAIRYCDDTTAGIAPVDYAERIRALDKLIPQPDALNFYMPDGGTITLTRVGSPITVTLEYSIDRGATWTDWNETNRQRTITLTAGQRVYVRNKSDSSEGFSQSANSYYQFAINGICYAYGNTFSLLERVPNINRQLYNLYQVFHFLFMDCADLITAPDLIDNRVSTSSYNCMFLRCSNLIKAPELLFTDTANYCCYRMFEGTKVNLIKTNMTNCSSNYAISNWLLNVPAVGDFYCPSTLTIPTGDSGIPSGWTRHDLPTE